MPESAVYVLEKMSHGFNRKGRAAGLGFYDYAADGARTLWSGLRTFERGGQSLPAQDVIDRLRYAIALEAIRSLERGELASLSAVDGNATTASGELFGSDRLREWIDSVGAAGFVDRANALATRYGARYAPPATLLQLAESGKRLA